MQKPYSISLYPGTGSADGRRGDHILLAPAYTITSDEVRQVVDVVVAVVTRYFAMHHPAPLHRLPVASSTSAKIVADADAGACPRLLATVAEQSLGTNKLRR
jgi:hypothetical protein